MGTKPYHDESWLHRKYILEDKSQKEIAEMCDVSSPTIQKWRDKNDIPKKQTSAAALNIPQWMELMYCEKRLSKTEIADRVGGTRPVVTKSLSKFGIEREEIETPPATFHCDNCGDEFTRERGETGGTRDFCTTECFHEWNSDHMTGENNPAYKDGSTADYGPNWDKQRQLAKERDGEKCQLCGMAAAVHEEKFGKDLNVHHIRPRREFTDSSGFDHKSANMLSNLVTLCAPCHTFAEGRDYPPQ